MSTLRERIAARLADTSLQEALAKALATVRTRSQGALAELADVDGTREGAGQLRHASVARMGRLLETLEQRLVDGGTTVLWARDAADVRRYVAEISSRYGTRRAILSKTMVGEELELEKCIHDAGMAVVQTDLGERVVQLAGQKPSHITAPCLHMPAAEVGKVLHEKGRLPYSDDPEQLSRSLARALRPQFEQAHIGFGGANLLVAETGTIVCLENEGNVRMGYTLPPVHVVVTGIEKVVESMADARRLLALLPRHATGQRATCYVSMLAPTPFPGQDRYVILVDNGRTELFNGGPFRDLLRCIRCGACMNICPVYERIGGHAYEWTYPGPIGIAMAPLVGPDGPATDGPQLCTLCGACTEICPVRIPLDRLILLGRAKARERRAAMELGLERSALRWFRRAMGDRASYRLADWGHRLGLSWFPGRVTRLERRLGLHDERAAPRPAKMLFRTWWKRRRQGKE